MKFRFYALKLCAFMLLVFILQNFFGSFSEFFILNKTAWSEPWRFLTAFFLHGSLVHLLFNCFALALFGSVLEKILGGNKFLLVFFTTGILANLISVNFYDSSLGASGAIFGVIGALIFIRPTMLVWTFGLPMPLFVAGIIWAAADILGAYGFFVGNPIDNTGNIAHLSGMLFGFIFGAFYRKHFKRKNKISADVSIDEREIRKWEEFYMK